MKQETILKRLKARQDFHDQAPRDGKISQQSMKRPGSKNRKK